jgi:hypothetical protein
MNFTYNNHLSYKIADRKFGHRETPYEKFTIDIGSVDMDYYRRSNWLQEQYRTAEIILKEYGNDLVVMFSGGTDSEIVLRAFKHIGFTPRTVFINFIGGHNSADLVIAQQIAKELDIDLEVINYDVIDFYKSGQAAEFAAEIQCRQMAYLSVYHHIRLLDVPAVMGGEMMLRRHVNIDGSKWYYCFRENEDASAMRFSLKYNIPLVNEWFSYTPEMVAHYMEHPRIQSLITERFNYKMTSVSSKNSILKELMPSIVDKIKTHGYEKLMGFNGESYASLYRTHTKRLESSLDGIFMDDLKIKLFGDNK